MSWYLQGGFEYKKAIVNTIIDIVEENSDAKESGLCFIRELKQGTFLPTRASDCQGN